MRWLWRKEISELALSPAFTILLVLAGLIVGHEFISAVATYAEMSGATGGGGAAAQGMNPLDGILVPTFGAYDIAATLLLPFVVIRVFAHERATGAWTLLVQSPARLSSMIAVKALALIAAWMLALVPGLFAVALWISYGGHVHGGELAVLLAGHLLRAGLTVGVAAAAAALTQQAASAAIVTLGVTVGSWALDFVAETRGGAWARVAEFTPGASLRLFEQGLVRASVVGVMVESCIIGLVVAGIWLAPGSAWRERVRRTAIAIALFIVAAAATSRVRASWDVTEDRRHSFAEADETALRALPLPLRIEIHLGAEDPRLADFRREILGRLERVVPRLDVTYAGAGGTGLFASADPHYGEIWYAMGGKRVMLKSAIEPVVLETIYALADLKAKPAIDAESYPGYPFRGQASFAWVIFFVACPAGVLAAFWRVRRS